MFDGTFFKGKYRGTLFVAAWTEITKYSLQHSELEIQRMMDHGFGF